MSGAPPLDWWDLPWEAVRDRLIRAMCPEKVCQTCGQPSRRIVEQTKNYAAWRAKQNAGEVPTTKYDHSPNTQRASGLASGVSGQAVAKLLDGPTHTTLGFSDCGHNDWRDGVVLTIEWGSQ